MCNDESPQLFDPEFNALAVPFAAFRESNRTVWFSLLESIFALCVTKKNSKFHYLVVVRPSHVVDEAQNVLDSTECNPYARIKAEIINRTGMIDRHRSTRLSTEPELKDCKPSQLRRHMRTLAGNSKFDGTPEEDRGSQAAI